MYNRKYLLNSLIGIALLLVLFSFVGILNEAGKQGITGMAISSFGDSGVPEGKMPEKIKAMWVYKDTNETQRDLAVSNGINTILTKIGYIDDLEVYNTKIEEFARYTKNKNISFFPVVNFRVCSTEFSGTDERSLYYNYEKKEMEEGNIIPLLNKEYWAYFTDKIKGLAELAKDSEYRIDGILIDFELYNGTGCITYPERFYYYRNYSNFDTTTFNEFVKENSLEYLDPPITEDKKLERYNWTRDNGFMDEWDNFLKQKMQEIAKNFKQEIVSENPNFLIGAYPSPQQYYIMVFDILKGWEDGKPGILFGDETYGIDSVKSYTLTKIDDYYFIYKKDFRDESVKVYYASGFLLRSYQPENFTLILESAKNSNGYWLFSSFNLFGNCSNLIGAAKTYRLPVKCETDKSNPGCCNQQTKLEDKYWVENCCSYYEESKQKYWNAIKQINYKLDCQETNNGIEICDNIDNNCNGQVDENLNCNVQTCSEAGFSCRVSCLTNETQVSYNCTTGICCEPQTIEQTCQERGYYCVDISNCSSGDKRNYECSSGVCCSKLPNSTIIIQQDKTCLEMDGLECSNNLVCDGSLTGTTDSKNCCLGNCVKSVEVPKNQTTSRGGVKGFVDQYWYLLLVVILIFLILIFYSIKIIVP